MSDSTIFISYSHRDDAWLVRLLRHLAPLRRAKRVDVWADIDIGPGNKWNDEIESALVAARVGVLLVSSHFLASEFIMGSELPALMRAAARGKLTLLWVPIEDSLWDQTDLQRVQCVVDPRKPLASLPEAAAEKALAKLARLSATALRARTGPAVDARPFTVSALELNDRVAPELFELSGLAPRAIASAFGATERLSGSYQTKQGRDGVIITSAIPYIDALRAGGPVGPVLFHWAPIMVPPVTLDLRLVNNTSKTLLINRIDLHVARSRPDLEPILVIPADRYGNRVAHFDLMNEGWGKVIDATLRFRCNPSPRELNPKPKLAGPFPHELALANFIAGRRVNLAPALAQEGVDWPALRRLRYISKTGSGPTAEVELPSRGDTPVVLTGKEHAAALRRACGPFRHGVADIVGEIAYKWQDGSRLRKQRLRFFTSVVLYARGRKGKPMPPSAAYHVELETKRSNYLRSVPLSHVVQPSEAERLLLHVSVPRSSVHRFVAKLVLSTGEEIASEPIELHALLPRTLQQLWKLRPQDLQLLDTDPRS